jgi:hypothetical protein
MDKDDFWSGVRLVVAGLADAAKLASYSLGFGAGGLGCAILALNYLSVTGVASTLIAMSAFFVAAQIGKALDRNAERAILEQKLVSDLKLKGLERRIEETARARDYSYKELYFLRQLAQQIAEEDSIILRKSFLDDIRHCLTI